MKKLISFFVVSGVICLISCGKAVPDNYGCTNALPAADSSALIKYAGDSIKLTEDQTGLFYQIIDSGTGAHPSATSRMVVNYVGRLLDNVVFDSQYNSNLDSAQLQGLIYGWRYGLPKIGAGGEIKLLIPSAYAWGCTGYASVPPNTPVYFDIQLLAVNN